jgi:TolB-like protein
MPASKRWPAGLLALAGFGALVGGVWLAGQRTGAEAALSGSPDGAGSEVRLAMTDLSEDPRPSIAVLPFADMSPEGDQEYFSDGMTEEILNVLAKVSELRVTARTSAFAFKGRDQDLRAVGDSLGVQYIVEGSVRKAGDQLRITAQLIDAADGSHMWSESYNEALTAENVFDIQTRIAGSISDALRVPLGIENASDLVTPTADLEAYDLYLAGRGHIRGRGAGLNEAIRLFEAAIARDSTWAPAWAGLAEATELLTWYPYAWEGGIPEEYADELAIERELQQAAEVAARRALELDPSAASAHVALGSVHRYRTEWDESEAAYLRALEIDPDNPEAFQQYSEMLGFVGRIEESVRTSERALALDRSPIKLLIYANALAYDGQVDEAIEQMELALELDREGSVPQIRSAWFYIHLNTGRFGEMYEHAPNDWGFRDEILRGLETGDLSAVPNDEISAEMWMLVGEPDRAAAGLLEVFTENPNSNAAYIWEAIYDPIRSHPDYLETLKIGNLEGRAPQRTPR